MLWLLGVSMVAALLIGGWVGCESVAIFLLKGSVIICDSTLYHSFISIHTQPTWNGIQCFLSAKTQRSDPMNIFIQSILISTLPGHEYVTMVTYQSHVSPVSFDLTPYLCHTNPVQRNQHKCIKAGMSMDHSETITRWIWGDWFWRSPLFSQNTRGWSILGQNLEKNHMDQLYT